MSTNANIIVSNYPPQFPSIGTLWYNELTKTLNIYTSNGWSSVNIIPQFLQEPEIDDKQILNAINGFNAGSLKYNYSVTNSVLIDSINFYYDNKFSEIKGYLNISYTSFTYGTKIVYKPSSITSTTINPTVSQTIYNYYYDNTGKLASVVNLTNNSGVNGNLISNSTL